MAASTSTSVLEIISSADLSPTDHLLLKHFVENAIDSELAAQYLSSIIDQSRDVEATLRSFENDWRQLISPLTSFDPIPERLDALVCLRDGTTCAMSKSEGGCDSAKTTAESAYIIPPSMAQSLESCRSSLVEILEAFLSPQHVERLKSLVVYPENDQAALRNLWRLSPSIHKVFRRGHVDIRPLAQVRAELGFPEIDREKTENQYYLRKLYPEEPSNLHFGDGTEFDSASWRFKLSTPDAALSLPSSFLFDIHLRFAGALHLFYLQDKIAKGWPKPEKTFIAPLIRHGLYHLSRYIPLWIRMRFYLLLRSVGRKLYGTESVHWVQRLPFGLYIKECINAPQNEPNALKLVEKYTTVPAPRVVDVGQYDGKTYLILSRLPGQQLGDVTHLMSYDERNTFADDLAACVSQLRKIPNNTPYKFGDTLGGPMVDHRIPGGRGGPFNTESDFNNHLTSHLDCTISEALGGQVTVLQDHHSCFTHSDFHASNLLVENGRLSGIVDWECAGYKPEYWEYTKAIYGSNWKPIQQAIFNRTFGNEYNAELELERKLWKLTPFGV